MACVEGPVTSPSDRWPSCAAAPVSLLLWRIGLFTSDGGLLPALSGHRLQLRLQLRRWPDFGAVGGGSCNLRMTSAPVRRAMSLSNLAELSSSPEQAASFLSACWLCDLLELLPEKSDAALPAGLPAAARTRGLLAQIGIFRSLRSALGPVQGL